MYAQTTQEAAPECLLLVPCASEQDFVEYESREMVLDAVEYYMKSKLESDPDKASESCRRADVLNAVLKANPLPVKPIEQRRNSVRNILKGKRSINKETESQLRKIGIRVSQGGKHPKLTLEADSRYVLTAPSSSSDRQAWHYLVRDIARKFF